MFMHRYGVFLHDGTGHSSGMLSYPFGGLVHPPVARSHDDAGPRPPDGAHNTYLLPMDDLYDHWLRLMGEMHVYQQHEHRDKAHASRAKHSGGLVHPDHAHIRLGGQIAWSAPPHPLVKAHMDWLHSLPDRDRFVYYCGPTVFDVGRPG